MWTLTYSHSKLVSVIIWVYFLILILSEAWAPIYCGQACACKKNLSRVWKSVCPFFYYKGRPDVLALHHFRFVLLKPWKLYHKSNSRTNCMALQPRFWTCDPAYTNRVSQVDDPYPVPGLVKFALNLLRIKTASVPCCSKPHRWSEEQSLSSLVNNYIE